MLRFALAWLLLCSTSLAQIELSYTVQKSFVGITQPVIVGDRILAGPDSKASESPVAMIAMTTEMTSPHIFAVQGEATADLTRVPDGRFMLVGNGRWVVFAVSGQTRAKLEVVIDGTPTPIPPGPRPQPEPTPDPQPNLPIGGEGFRVMMIYESDTLSKVPESQKAAMFGAAVREYLNAKTTRVAGAAEWRLVDKDVDMQYASEIWRDAIKQPRMSLPWLLISNGKQGYSGPLPMNQTETLSLLKKFGGE